MSLAPLRFVYKKGGEVEINELQRNRAGFDEDCHYHDRHDLNHDLLDYFREGFVKFDPDVDFPPTGGKVKLTEKGKRAVEVSMEAPIP
jgi:hypothetical protein